MSIAMIDVATRIGVPLRIRPTFDPKPWGGRRLEGFGKSLPPGAIGESIESGPDAMVNGGPFDGVSLGDIMARYPRSLLGERGEAACRDVSTFPLLVKLIDAQDDLSVQVHPGDTDAPAGKRGKTEAWLILATEPGASLITGVSGRIDPEQIEAAIVREAVTSGDVFLVPAGTVHAIGRGVLLYEVQQASDVTYRLFDWGRQREMHLEEGIRVARADSHAQRVIPLRLDRHREMLVACQHFALERWAIGETMALSGDGQTCRVMTVVSGAARVGDVTIHCGESVVLPSDLDPTPLAPDGPDVSVLMAFIPDIEADVVTPLVDADHDRSSIEQLGISVS